MPSTVGSLIAACGAEWKGSTRWGQKPSLTRPGIYLISGSSDPFDPSPVAHEAPISADSLRALLAARNVTVDGHPATLDALARRLADFWLPDESAVYIGKADVPVARRVDQYFRTPLGARSPHRGGWFLKTTSVLDDLWVHAAESNQPEKDERAALREFIGRVSEPVRTALYDPSLPLPFANLELPKGRRKSHGIRGATAPRR